jgi:GxxExxY protein
MNKNISKIKAIAKDVYRVLGSGFTESVYDKAMQVGLRSAKIRYDSQKVVELLYKGHYVGEGYLDLIVYLGKERILVELKAVSGELGSAEDTQIRNYMRRLKIKHGLLVNFQQPGKKEGKTKLEFKEVNL